MADDKKTLEELLGNWDNCDSIREALKPGYTGDDARKQIRPYAEKYYAEANHTTEEGARQFFESQPNDELRDGLIRQNFEAAIMHYKEEAVKVLGDKAKDVFSGETGKKLANLAMDENFKKLIGNQEDANLIHAYSQVRAVAQLKEAIDKNIKDKKGAYEGLPEKVEKQIREKLGTPAAKARRKELLESGKGYSDQYIEIASKTAELTAQYSNDPKRIKETLDLMIKESEDEVNRLASTQDKKYENKVLEKIAETLGSAARSGHDEKVDLALKLAYSAMNDGKYTVGTRDFYDVFPKKATP